MITENNDFFFHKIDVGNYKIDNNYNLKVRERKKKP